MSYDLDPKMNTFPIDEFLQDADTHMSSQEKHLTVNSPRFLCPDISGHQCYYEAFPLNPSITGNYHFEVDSDIDISVYLYQTPFNPAEPNQNLIFNGYRSNQQMNVRFAALLHAHNSMILVITTQHGLPDSSLKVTIEGPSMVNFQTDRMYISLISYDFFRNL